MSVGADPGVRGDGGDLLGARHPRVHPVEPDRRLELRARRVADARALLAEERACERAIGVERKAQFFAWIGLTSVLGVVFFHMARALRRRQGIEIDYAYAEIPPE